MNYRKVEIYTCEQCGREFYSREECETHEKTHVEDFENASGLEVAKRLDELAERAYGYRIGNEVLGLPLRSFYNLMDRAKRLLQEQKV